MFKVLQSLDKISDDIGVLELETDRVSSGYVTDLFN